MEYFGIISRYLRIISGIFMEIDRIFMDYLWNLHESVISIMRILIGIYDNINENP